MSTTPSRSAVIDAPAIAFSGLCFIHCLILPVLSAGLPSLGVLAEAEWLHKGFVIAALPFSLIALASKQTSLLAGGLIVVGFSLLVAGAFVEALHDYETLLTVIGAIVLASGHVVRWSRTNAHGQS
ncbi:MAG: MerC domain-containing protein [Pseudomonadota bacterium]